MTFRLRLKETRIFRKQRDVSFYRKVVQLKRWHTEQSQDFVRLLYLYYREIVHIGIHPLCLKGSFAFEKDGSFGAARAKFQHLQVGVSVSTCNDCEVKMLLHTGVIVYVELPSESFYGVVNSFSCVR